MYIHVITVVSYSSIYHTMLIGDNRKLTTTKFKEKTFYIQMIK